MELANIGGSDGYRRAPEFVVGGDFWSRRPEEALMVEKPRELAGRVVMRKTSPERDWTDGQRRPSKLSWPTLFED